MIRPVRRRVVASMVAFTLAGAAVVHAAGGFPQPSICTRSCWGARSTSVSQMGSLTRAVVHHTATAADFNTTSQSTSAANVRAIQNYHMDTNGWADIGYHFLVDKLGNRFEGRNSSISAKPSGAHDGVNSNSMGFNLMGYFHSPYNQTPPSVQRNAMYDIIAWKMPTGFTGYGGGSYGGRSNVGYLCGHRDALATACPGDLYYNNYMGTNLSGGEARNAVNSRITGGGGVEVVVDNASSAFAASANWYTSTSTAGYYGTNYHVRGTEAVSDSATFKGSIPSDGNWEVYVRFPAGTNRPSAAPHIVYHTGGSTTVNVNQQANSNVWVSLGTYNMYQGTTADRVKVSCWTTAGFYVIADAVKFVQR